MPNGALNQPFVGTVHSLQPAADWRLLRTQFPSDLNAHYVTLNFFLELEL